MHILFNFCLEPYTPLTWRRGDGQPLGGAGASVFYSTPENYPILNLIKKIPETPLHVSMNIRSYTSRNDTKGKLIVSMTVGPHDSGKCTEQFERKMEPTEVRTHDFVGICCC